jgi:hypothetical protein
VRVTDVVIEERLQGLKLCSRLFAEGKKWIESIPELRILELSVRGGCKAEDVYRHYGFREFGRLPGGVQEAWEGGKIYDEVYMCKEIGTERDRH